MALLLRSLLLQSRGSSLVTVRLTWDYPAMAADGFRIFYGAASHADVLVPDSPVSASPYDSVVMVEDGELREYDLDLEPGIYCFRLTALVDDEESIFSGEIVWSSGVPAPTSVLAATI